MRIPFLENNEKKSKKKVQVTLYIPEKLHAEILNDAARKDWSFNKYCVKVLEAFKAP